MQQGVGRPLVAAARGLLKARPAPRVQARRAAGGGVRVGDAWEGRDDVWLGQVWGVLACNVSQTRPALPIYVSASHAMLRHNPNNASDYCHHMPPSPPPPPSRVDRILLPGGVLVAVAVLLAAVLAAIVLRHASSPYIGRRDKPAETTYSYHLPSFIGSGEGVAEAEEALLRAPRPLPLTVLRFPTLRSLLVCLNRSKKTAEDDRPSDESEHKQSSDQ